MEWMRSVQRIQLLQWCQLLWFTLDVDEEEDGRRVLTLGSLLASSVDGEAVTAGDTTAQADAADLGECDAADRDDEGDRIDPAMMVPDVAKRIHEAGLVEDTLPMSMAISRWRREGRRDRPEDDTAVDVAPMVSKMSREAM